MKKISTISFRCGCFGNSDIGNYIVWENGKKYIIEGIINETTCFVRCYFDIFRSLEYWMWKLWFIIKREIYYWYHPNDPELRYLKRWYRRENTSYT